MERFSKVLREIADHLEELEDEVEEMDDPAAKQIVELLSDKLATGLGSAAREILMISSLKGMRVVHVDPKNN